jgi:hypothetical protein
MNIVCDFELTEGYEFSEKGQKFISEIKKFVSQRLGVLQSEIDDEGGRIVLVILGTPPRGLRLEGFSPDLVKKIEYSVSNEDFIYFLSKMGQGE